MSAGEQRTDNGASSIFARRPRGAPEMARGPLIAARWRHPRQWTRSARIRVHDRRTKPRSKVVPAAVRRRGTAAISPAKVARAAADGSPGGPRSPVVRPPSLARAVRAEHRPPTPSRRRDEALTAASPRFSWWAEPADKAATGYPDRRFAYLPRSGCASGRRHDRADMAGATGVAGLARHQSHRPTATPAAQSAGSSCTAPGRPT